MFCCSLLYVHSSIAIILMGKRELVALLNLSSWCLVMVEWLFLAVPRGCLQFVIVVFPDHTHLLFLFVCFESLRPSQQFFSYDGMGLSGLNQYKARNNVSCSRTQHSDTSKARTCKPSVSIQALY